MAEKIRIKFDGGLAAQGKLHFYEYGRSQYATARFISTIENFRRTGTVAQRIVTSSYVEIFVSVPTKGSFQEFIEVVSKDVAVGSASSGLSGIISYIWGLLVPRSQQTETDLVELAKIRLDEERERTKQQALQTSERQNIAIAHAENLNKALETIDWALKANNPRIATVGLDQRRLLDIQDEIQEEEARAIQMSKAQTEIDQISPEQLAILTSRLRTIVPEMALPL